jgi:ATP-dependent RNA helicase MSS116, mitochondrial
LTFETLLQPTDKAQYVHRLGRTARAGKEGSGILLLCDFEKSFLHELEDLPLTQRGGMSMAQASGREDALVKSALAQLSASTTAAAYQAWLGFYNGRLRKLGWSKGDLVREANDLVLR